MERKCRVCGGSIPLRPHGWLGAWLSKYCSDKCRSLVKSEYMTWMLMRQRCNNPKMRTDMWMNYGGRGIKICDRWNNSFEAFFADMGPKPSPKHTIDRIDVNGNYEPNNCRWVTWDVQHKNKRRKGKNA